MGFSGIYYNKDLFAANNVAVPTTWSELVTACQTFTAANIPCMTAGGKDGWPIFVGAYGLLGAAFPDQAALVQGLWEGTIKYTDPAWVDLLAKYQIYNRDMMEPGASGLAGDAAPGRFASGAVAMFPGGTWYGPAIEAAQPAFEWGYIPFPGSDTAADNQYMFGKYDQGWAIAANSPNKDAALGIPDRVLRPGELPGVRDGRRAHPDPAGRHARYRRSARSSPPTSRTSGSGSSCLWTRPRARASTPQRRWSTCSSPSAPTTTRRRPPTQAQADLQAGLDASQ